MSLKGSSERRHRLRLMEQGAKLLGNDRDRLRSDLPHSLSGVLASPRFNRRLSARLLKHSGVIDAPELLECEELALLTNGEQPFSVEGLIVRIGAACHTPSLRRVVHRDAVLALTSELDIGLSEMSRIVQSAPKGLRLQMRVEPVQPGEADDLPRAIRIDGARCWLAWVDTKPKQVAHLLRLATPLAMIDAAGALEGLSPTERTARAALAGRKIAKLNAERTGQATPIAAE